MFKSRSFFSVQFLGLRSNSCMCLAKVTYKKVSRVAVFRNFVRNFCGATISWGAQIGTHFSPATPRKIFVTKKVMQGKTIRLLAPFWRRIAVRRFRQCRNWLQIGHIFFFAKCPALLRMRETLAEIFFHNSCILISNCIVICHGADVIDHHSRKCILCATFLHPIFIHTRGGLNNIRTCNVELVTPPPLNITFGYRWWWCVFAQKPGDY